jgi:transposase
VGIDPGKNDLLFAITVPDPDKLSCRKKKNATKLRYTQNQRRKEQQIKKRRNLILEWKNASRIEGKTVVEWEALLAYDPITSTRYTFNSKSLQSSQYQNYLHIKNLVTHKFRLHTYSNTQRSESNFMNRFRETFGNPDKVVVGFGDWNEKGHRKGHEPLKGIGFHKMIRNAGYEVFLVNEHRTSKTCSNCSNCENGGFECEYFRKCNNPRPWKREEVIDRHGLVICKACRTPWNRDVNASINIHNIMKSTIAGKGRPSYFLKPKVAELPRPDLIGLVTQI